MANLFSILYHTPCHPMDSPRHMPLPFHHDIIEKIEITEEERMIVMKLVVVNKLSDEKNQGSSGSGAGIYRGSL